MELTSYTASEARSCDTGDYYTGSKFWSFENKFCQVLTVETRSTQYCSFKLDAGRSFWFGGDASIRRWSRGSLRDFFLLRLGLFPRRIIYRKTCWCHTELKLYKETSCTYSGRAMRLTTRPMRWLFRAWLCVIFSVVSSMCVGCVSVDCRLTAVDGSREIYYSTVSDCA